MVVLMKNNDVSKSFTPANNESIDMWYLPLWPLDGTVRPVDLTSTPCQIVVVVFLTSLPNRKFTRCCRRAGTPRDRLSRGSSSTRPCSTSRPAPCSSSPQPGPRAQSNLVITELCAGGRGRGREGGRVSPMSKSTSNNRSGRSDFCVDILFIGFALRRPSIVPIS